MSKVKRYEVVYSIWDTRSYMVLADDEDDAIKMAEQQLLDEVHEGASYEVLDIFEGKLERTEEE